MLCFEGHEASEEDVVLRVFDLRAVEDVVEVVVAMKFGAKSLQLVSRARRLSHRGRGWGRRRGMSSDGNAFAKRDAGFYCALIEWKLYSDESMTTQPPDGAG